MSYTYNKRRKRHGRTVQNPCKWLRDHSASMKPEKDFRIRLGEFTYWKLTNGQIVHEVTARRMGL